MANDRPNVLHYTAGDIEPIEYIEAQGWMVAFCLGNIIKYASRCMLKGEPINDLCKIRRYAEMLEDYIDRRTDAD